MKYDIGDKIRIKSLDWYNENKDKYGEVDCKGCPFVNSMTLYCNSILTIEDKTEYCYWVKENVFSWTDEMIEGLVEEKCDYVQVDNIPDVIQAKTSSVCSHNGFYGYSDSEGNETSEWYLPDGYIFKDENGNIINATKIVLEKKNEYPKTYDDCCKILGLNSEITDSELLFYHSLKCGDYTTIRLPEMEKFEKFIQLYLCRNAYWKLYGEEMGLGGPWKPDWSKNEKKYTIEFKLDYIHRSMSWVDSCILAFPSEELRDVFYENFKESIEQCKELL